MRPRALDDLLVVGIGNPLRGDDGVGLLLTERLRRHFGGALACEELFQADILVAGRLVQRPRLLVIDAAVLPGRPFELLRLEPAPSVVTPAGFVSHVVGWPQILAAARDLFGARPVAHLCAVGGLDFGFGEGLSPACAGNAEAAFAFLVDFVRTAGVPVTSAPPAPAP
jgi:hydrogenase maturation protease